MSFIVIEGPDGVGKTVQAHKLVFALQKMGIRATYINEPSTSVLGTFLRDHALDLNWRSLALLFAAERHTAVQEVILPSMRAGLTVVSDRYDHSSFVYQGMFAENESDLWWLQNLNVGIPRPDLTIILGVDPIEAKRRRIVRNNGQDAYEDLQYGIANRYAELNTGAYFHEPIVHVDGMGSEGAVGERILACVL